MSTRIDKRLRTSAAAAVVAALAAAPTSLRAEEPADDIQRADPEIRTVVPAALQPDPWAEQSRVVADEKEGEVRDAPAEPDDARGSTPAPATLRDGPIPAGATGALPGESTTKASGAAISLPSGNAKIDGMGESFSTQLSTGTATFSVPIKLPSARGQAQASLALTYNSGSGFDVAGVGWSLSVPFISRQTDRGIPRYDDRAAWHPEQDRFVFNGGQELVPICRVAAGGGCVEAATLPAGEQIPAWFSGWQYFRARVESSFLRFFWSPDHRTWRVQSKSGVTMELGASLETGAAGGVALEQDPNDPTRIYKWALVRQYDAYGAANPPSSGDAPAPANVVQYRYLVDGGKLYLSDLYDTPAPGDAALAHYAHHTHLDYEARTDPTASYRSGWLIEQNMRLVRAAVSSKSFAAGTSSTESIVRTYELTYSTERHVSLLRSIQVHGKGDPTCDTPNACLPPMLFSYTHVGEADASFEGYEPFDETQHTIAKSPENSLDEQLTDLFDLNSDALPDVLVTAPAIYGGQHGVWFNGGSSSDNLSFAADRIVTVPIPGDTVDANVLKLSNPNVVPLDIDGDGRSNLVHMPRVKRYSVFQPELVGGQWSWIGRSISTADQQNPKIDFTRDASTTRLMDVNFDGLIDVVVSTGTELETFFALGRYPNGDGQFGQAHWDPAGRAWKLSTDPVTSCVPWSSQALRFSDSDFRVADMNGDAIPDLVRVRAGDVRYWPGRGNGFWGTGDPSACGAGNFGQGQDVAMDSSPQFGVAQAGSLLLDDVTGDGLADLVEVRFDAVDIYVNVDGRSWTNRHVIYHAPPFSEATGTRVRLTDINGTGTPDILWGNGRPRGSSSGGYQYIDLMGGQRPWLLAQVANGLGKTTAIDYSTSTNEMLAAQASNPWTSKMPMVAHVVKRVTESDNLATAGRGAVGTDRTEYAYRDPVYDGRQREFRGFRQTTTTRVGDGAAATANSPTDVTTTQFLLGECVSENASGLDPCAIENRFLDNPREALKGLPVVTERSDGSGSVFLSTEVTAYNLRTLYTGLDGRLVRYAFASEDDRYLYDTGPFAPATGPTTNVPVVRVEGSSCTPSNLAACSVTAAVTLKSNARALLVSSTDADFFGNQTTKTSKGCTSGCASTDEVITTFDVPGRPAGDATGWLWRTTESYVTGNQQRPVPSDGTWSHTFTTYNAQGDPTRVQAFLDGTLPLKRRDESSALNPPRSSTTPGLIDVVSSRTYDGVGNVTQETGPNGRCRSVSYATDVYQQLPTSDTVFTAGCGSANGLTVAAAYDRGLGAITTYVDVQLQTTTVSYDPLGRLSSIVRPGATAGSSCAMPSVQLSYSLPALAAGADIQSNPASLQSLFTRAFEIIHTRTQDGTSCDSSSDYLESYSYSDGLGRAIVTLKEADPRPQAGNDAGQWIASSETQFDDKGAAHEKFLDYFWNGDPMAFPVNAAPVGPAGSSSPPFSEQRYDAFGRQRVTLDLDGTPTLQTVYHTVSSDSYDAADIAAGAAATPLTERKDGHGRTAETIERFHEPALVERHTRIEYTPTNRPERITRSRSGSADVVRWMRYDSLGRMVLNVEPNTSKSFTSNKDVAPDSVQAFRYAYDDAGDLVGTSDTRSCGAGYFYDGAGRVLLEDYFPCESHHLAYSRPSTTAGDPTGAEVFYEYDRAPAFGTSRPRRLSLVSNLLKGRLVRVRDRGSDAVFDYDARGRQIGLAKRISVPNPATSATLVNRYAPRWYERQTSYDAADRPVSESTGVPPNDGLSAETVPQLLGTNGLSTLTYTYSHRGTLGAVGGSYGAIVSAFTRAADGPTAQVVYGDVASTHTDSQFDARRRLHNVKTTRTAPSNWPANSQSLPPSTFQTELQNATFTYDVVSNPKRIDDLRDPSRWPAGAKPVTRTMGYDELNRVTSIQYDSNGDSWTAPFASENALPPTDTRRATPSPQVSFPSRVHSQTVAYDWLGNTSTTDDDAHGFYDRSLGTVTNGTAADGPNQLRSATNATSGGSRTGSLIAKYDAMGNVTRLAVRRAGPCVPLLANCNQWFEYQWDEVGRLVRASRWDGFLNDPNGTAVPPLPRNADLQYAYDANDQRVLKTSSVVGADRSTVYVFDTLELRRAEFELNATLAQDYELSSGNVVVYLLAEGRRLGRVEWEAPDPVTVLPRQRTYLEIGDNLSSTSMVVEKSSSELVERSTYQAYGAPDSDYRPNRWANFREDYRFTGKEEDVEVGLQYFGRRFYSPNLNRWISPDPLAVGEPGSADLNLYAYVGGRALQAVDPLGLDEASEGFWRGVRDQARLLAGQLVSSALKSCTWCQLTSHPPPQRIDVKQEGPNLKSDSGVVGYYAGVSTFIVVTGTVAAMSGVAGVKPRAVGVPRVGVTPKFAPVAVAIDESTIGAELNARAQQIRDSLVEARVLTKFGARKTAVGVTQPDVAGAPRIITFSNSTAYEAVQKGRFQLAPGEELGPPPRFDEAGDLMEESHVEFLGAEHATDKYNAKGGWIGTVPQQCPNCATRMSGGTWIHTKPNSGTTVSAAPKEAVGQ